MRKRDLLQRIKELIEQNAELSERNAELETMCRNAKDETRDENLGENTELKKQNEELTAEINELKARIAELEEKLSDLSQSDSQSEADEEGNDNIEEPQTPSLFEKIEKSPIEETAVSQTLSNDEIPEKFRYAADVLEKAAELTEELCSKIKTNADEKALALLPSVSEKFTSTKSKMIDLVAYNDDMPKIKEQGNAFLTELEGYFKSLESLI